MEDYYIVEEANDQLSDDDCSSSDDELDFRRLTQKESDAFEKEMEAERDTRFEEQRCNPQTRHASNPDDEDDESSRESNSNDALFYDPKADGKDEEWVSRLRTLNGSVSQEQIKTDATLNCPFCMSLVCLECQRHEVYKTQYRAMFVFNCFVDFSQKLEYKTRRRRKKHRLSSVPVDAYYGVKCTVCGTQVAMYDKEQVYHFFNVLASFA